MSDRELTYQGPKLEIAGRDYTVRRLGLLDIQWLAKLIAGGTNYIDQAAAAHLQTMSVEMIGSFILGYLPTAFDEIVDWMAGLIGISKEEIRDPNIFPLGSELQVAEALCDHEDVVAFFDRAKKLSKHPGLKAMMERLRKPSTESKKGTAGRTKKS